MDASRKTQIHLEWIIEPVDNYGDITDPTEVVPNTRAAAMKAAAAMIKKAGARGFLRYADVVLVTRKGNDVEGEIDRVYGYVARFHCDGRVTKLETAGDSMAYDTGIWFGL